jgi:ADP-ribose pyrophosphatase YjhB (NUDIX family)
MESRVRAVIIENGKVLLIKRTKSDIIYWATPGGGVEGTETDEQTLVRECKEELGVEVKVNDLLLKAVSQKPAIFGQEERFYLCDITGGELGTGDGPEFTNPTAYAGQYDIEWRTVAELSELDLRPQEIKDLVYTKFLKKV